jgi:uncharacterized protein YggT (Ycf19 family)
VPLAVLLVNAVITLLILTLVVRIILANLILFVGRDRLGPVPRAVSSYLSEVTEPVLSPIRRMLPAPKLPLDFSPLVTIIALDLIGRFLTYALLRVL